MLKSQTRPKIRIEFRLVAGRLVMQVRHQDEFLRSTRLYQYMTFLASNRYSINSGMYPEITDEGICIGGFKDEYDHNVVEYCGVHDIKKIMSMAVKTLEEWVENELKLEE